MKILHCGSYIPADLISSYPNSSEAANNFQEKIIRELRKYSDVNVLSYIGYYVPPAKLADLKKKLKDNSIEAVINTGPLSRLTNYYHYYKKYIALLKESDAVVFYNIYFMYILIWMMNFFYKRKLILILADYSEPQEINSFIRRLMQRMMISCIQRFEYACILSYEAYKKIHITHKLFFPGAINFKDFQDFSLKKTNRVRFLYSGLLNEVTGIDLLLEAINLVENDDCEFLFTGRGEFEQDLRLASEQDSRIVYKGFLSREEYYSLLDSVDVVINPRNMNLPQNHNNFPSKIMEYLASGRLIVSTRFAGFELFHENVLAVDSNAESLAQGLKKAINVIEEHQNEDYYYKNRAKSQEYDWEIMGAKFFKFIEAAVCEKL